MKLDCDIYACKLNNDGSTLLLGTDDSKVRKYELRNGKCQLKRCDEFQYVSTITDIDVSPYGLYYTISSCTKYCFIVSLNTGERRSIEYHWNVESVQSVRFSPCGKFIAGSCAKGKVNLFNREIGFIHSFHAPFSGNNEALCYLSDSDSNSLLTGDTDGLVELWDLRYGIYVAPI